MKQNRSLTLVGRRVNLVPYTVDHVPKYHFWMQDPEILKATASEPLTLKEEYEMQQKWAEDDDKCTFIVLDKELVSQCPSNEAAAMAGDVNLFISGEGQGRVAEAEVMIAEPHRRRKGLACEAVAMMMMWAYTALGLQAFQVKIGDANQASISLFDKMGFEWQSHSKVFQETTFSLNLSVEAKLRQLQSLAPSLQCLENHGPAANSPVSIDKLSSKPP